MPSRKAKRPPTREAMAGLCLWFATEAGRLERLRAAVRAIRKAADADPVLDEMFGFARLGDLCQSLCECAGQFLACAPIVPAEFPDPLALFR